MKMNKRIKKKHFTTSPRYAIVPKVLRLKYQYSITKPRYKQLEIAVIRKAKFLGDRFIKRSRYYEEDQK
jgi:hypothetical protein